MRHLKFFITSLVIFLVVSSAVIVAQDSGLSITCDDGTNFTNGVEFIVNGLDTGVSYRATAIGLGNFDPIIALMSDDGTICVDNADTAASYSMNLPTTGLVPSSATSAQIEFSQSATSSSRSLIIGSQNSASGEFTLILEGLNVSRSDGAGDLVSVNISNSVAGSGIPLSAYMISVGDALDTLINNTDESGSPIYDDNGLPIGCDDAGDAGICWGAGSRSLLDSSFVSVVDGERNGGIYDSALVIPLTGGQRTVTFQMTTADQSIGDYLVVFHVGLGSGSGAGVKPTKVPLYQTPQATIEPPPSTPTPSAANNRGISVNDCPNGLVIENGVEIQAALTNPPNRNAKFTVTVIGIGDFDPVVAILDENARAAYCDNNNGNASQYRANLPTSGDVPPSNRSAQIEFRAFSDNKWLSIVVGDFNNRGGQFIVLLDGLTRVRGDEDYFAFSLWPRLVNSGVPATVYMMATSTDPWDPQIYWVENATNAPYIYDGQGEPVGCNDAGSNSCWGESFFLRQYFFSRPLNRQANGRAGDAMLSIDFKSPEAEAIIGDQGLVVLQMTSANRSYGPYALAFHLGM